MRVSCHLFLGANKKKGKEATKREQTQQKEQKEEEEGKKEKGGENKGQKVWPAAMVKTVRLGLWRPDGVSSVTVARR